MNALDWVKSKLAAEKAAVVGFLVTVLWAVNDAVTGESVDWKALVPLLTALVIRVFVTSDGVQPGL